MRIATSFPSFQPCSSHDVRDDRGERVGRRVEVLAVHPRHENRHDLDLRHVMLENRDESLERMLLGMDRVVHENEAGGSAATISSRIGETGQFP